MMIGNEIYFVADQGSVPASTRNALLDRMGVKSIPVLNNLKAQLEVRIQPRGLSAPDKPVSIDVMSSFRLSGKPPGGAKII
jgi:hypothetical protein